jgi:hypothetical protein
VAGYSSKAVDSLGSIFKSESLNNYRNICLMSGANGFNAHLSYSPPPLSRYSNPFVSIEAGGEVNRIFFHYHVIMLD